MGKSRNARNPAALVLALLAGEVAGGFFGMLMGLLADAVPALSFLRALDYGVKFGMSAPATLDLGAVALTGGIMFNFTVWGVVGMAAAWLILFRFRQ
ncbi:MAG: DUF4321 domain-containing protein [Clostridiales bacterium]|jgi:hypothetical protein|nr:DUF4321 domain-containing protein [Clostridiales bacterium]